MKPVHQPLMQESALDAGAGEYFCMQQQLLSNDSACQALDNRQRVCNCVHHAGAGKDV